MLSLPALHFEAVLLSEMQPHQNMEAARLITIRRTGSDGSESRQLGYLAAAGAEYADPVLRPLDASWLGFRARGVLATDRQTDVDILQKVFGGGSASTASSHAAVAEALVAAEQDEAARLSATPIQQRFAKLSTWVLSTLQAYSTVSWREMKETAFTAPLNKFLELKMDAATCDDTDIVEKADEWADAMSRAKAFTKKCKDYQKMHKHSKLLLLSPHTQEWVSFLETKEIAVHVSLVLLKLRVQFMVSPEFTVHARLNELKECGLDQALLTLSGETTSCGVTPDGWLRGTMLQSLSLMIDGAAIADIDTVRSGLFNDMTASLDVINSLEARAHLDTLITDLHCLRTVFDAGREGSSVTVAEATRAQVALKSSRFTLLDQTFAKSNCGAELTSNLFDILRRGATDDAGDKRLQLSSSSMQDVQLPRFAATDMHSTLLVTGLDLVFSADAQLFTSLQVVLQYAREAVRMWSRIRFDEHKHNLRAVLRQMVDSVHAIDIAFAMALADMCENPVSHPDEETDVEGDDDTSKPWWLSAFPHPAMVKFKLHNLASIYSSDSEFSLANANFVKLLQTFGNDIKDVSQSCTLRSSRRLAQPSSTRCFRVRSCRCSP